MNANDRAKCAERHAERLAARHRPSPVTALVAALVVALIAGCGATPPAGDAAKPASGGRVTTALPVRVLAAGPGKVVETLAVQGRLEVWQRLILSPKVAGIVQEVPVLSNQAVAAGAPLLRLQAPLADIEAALKAESKLERARRDLDRREQLRKVAPETISIADIDTARDLVMDAQLEVETYHRREANRVLVAPFAGVVLMPPTTAAANTQTVIAGQQLSEGAQVAELLDVSRFRLSLDLPETNLPRLAVGQSVTITPIADSVTAKGTISAMPEAIDATKGSGRVLVDITAPPKSWRPGGFIAAQLVLGETEAALVLPRETVLYRENRPYAWVAEEHEGVLVVRRAWLELGSGDSKTLVVTKGIMVGDRVVAEGMNGLSDGVPVSIRDDQTAAVPAPAAEQPK
jgi:RND family efflux transporter MFP subunit